MIANIISNLGYDNTHLSVLILVDNGFSEFLKWRNEIPQKIPILSIQLTSSTKNIIKLMNPDIILCFISEKIDYNILLNEINLITKYKELIILTTLSQELFETNESINKTFPVRYIHIPCHTINILHGRNKNIGLFNLMSPSCRNVFPIILHHLGNVSNSTLLLNNKRISKIHQIAAEDIPVSSRQGLKLLAHELAGSLIFNQGLDPTGFVYSVGKTSSLVGHTIQSILANLLQQRSSQSHEGFNLMSSPSSSPSSPSTTTTGTNSPLRPCTLLLMDRTIDLFTPSSHDSSPSLAHRIFCTIKNSQSKLNPQLDISLSTPLLDTLYSNNIENLNLQKDPFDMSTQPLSAVSSLPIQLLPSITPPYINKSDNNNSNNNVLENDQFMNAVFATNEEKGKNILYDELRKEIIENNGTLPPPKKRGIGAEILGLVNALLSIPSSNNESNTTTTTTTTTTNTSYNVDLTIKSSGLLSWSLGIIDSMQRSSTKQLQSHILNLNNSNDLLQCLSSYEIKSTREKILLSLIIQQYQLSLISYPILIDIILEICGLSTNESTNNNNNDNNNSIDVEHMLTMILSTFSLIESNIEIRKQNEYELQEILSKISKTMSNFLLKICNIFQNSPIIELKRLQFLSDDIIKDICEYRELNVNLPNEDVTISLGERLIMELDDIILNFIDILNELSIIRSSSLDPSTISNTITSSSSTTTTSSSNIVSSLSSSNDNYYDMLTNYEISTIISTNNNIINSKHKVLKRGPNEENKSGNLTKTSGSSIALPIGILSRITSEIVKERMKYLSGKIPNKIPLLFHIENPIFSIARAGFGLLSSSLGRLGLGTNVSNEITSHPSSNSILVIFIIGGVSLNEIKQIQELLNNENNLYSDIEVIIGSNNIITPQNIYQHIFIR